VKEYLDEEDNDNEEEEKFIEEDFSVMEMIRNEDSVEIATELPESVEDITTVQPELLLDEEEAEEEQTTVATQDQEEAGLTMTLEVIQDQQDSESEILEEELTTEEPLDDEEVTTFANDVEDEIEEKVHEEDYVTSVSVVKEVNEAELVEEVTTIQPEEEEVEATTLAASNEEPAEEDRNSTFDMIMNVIDHFNLNMLMSQAHEEIQQEEETTIAPIEEEQFEASTLMPSESSIHTTTVPFITEESEEETIHVVLPMGWNPDDMIMDGEKTTSTPQVGKDSSEEQETSPAPLEEESSLPVTTTAEPVEQTSTESQESSTSTTTRTTTSTTTSTTTTSEDRSPKAFGGTRLNRIRQRLRNPTLSSASPLEAVKLINSRLNKPERPTFIPSSASKEDEEDQPVVEASQDQDADEDQASEVSSLEQQDSVEDELKTNKLLDRRKELFKKRVRVQRPSAIEISEANKSSGLPVSEDQPSVVRNRFSRLRRPSSEDESEALDSDPEASKVQSENVKSVRCKFFKGRGCDNSSEQ